jgi:hypothetical protein
VIDFTEHLDSELKLPYATISREGYFDWLGRGSNATAALIASNQLFCDDELAQRPRSGGPVEVRCIRVLHREALLTGIAEKC